VTKITLAAVLLAAPMAAHAGIGLRVGGEAIIGSHDSNAGWTAITDNWPLGVDVMLSYWTSSLLSLDLEYAGAWFANPPSGFSSRVGSTLRPGIRLDLPLIYLRGAIPIALETPSNAAYQRATWGLRAGAGINIPLVIFKIYIEGDFDFPLGGGTNTPSAFSRQTISLNSGLDFRF